MSIGPKRTLNAIMDGRSFTLQLVGGTRIGVVRALVDSGADIEAKDKLGSTPLQSAALRRQKKVVQLFALEYMCDAA